MRTSDKTNFKADDDYRVSEHVLEMFEKKYSKHFPKKKYLNFEEPYLDRKETFKDGLFQWIFNEDPWEKDNPKEHTLNKVNEFFNFMTAM